MSDTKPKPTDNPLVVQAISTAVTTVGPADSFSSDADWANAVKTTATGVARLMNDWRFASGLERHLNSRFVPAVILGGRLDAKTNRVEVKYQIRPTKYAKDGIETSRTIRKDEPGFDELSQALREAKANGSWVNLEIVNEGKGTERDTSQKGFRTVIGIHVIGNGKVPDGWPNDR